MPTATINWREFELWVPKDDPCFSDGNFGGGCVDKPSFKISMELQPYDEAGEHFPERKSNWFWERLIDALENPYWRGLIAARAYMYFMNQYEGKYNMGRSFGSNKEAKEAYEAAKAWLKVAEMEE